MQIPEINTLQMNRTEAAHTGVSKLSDIAGAPLNSIPNAAENGVERTRRSFEDYLLQAFQTMNQQQVDVSNLNPTAEIPKEVLKIAEEKITKTINDLFDKLKRSKCDLFQVEDALYQKYYSHYSKLSGLTLEKLQLKTTIKCQSEKSTRL